MAVKQPAGLSWQQVVLTIGLAFIAAVPPSIIAWNAKTEAIAAKDQAAETHKAVNSRMTELLELTRRAAEAEGVVLEKQAQQNREGEAAFKAARPRKK